MERYGLGAVLLLALGAYALSVGHGFAYDDVYIIERNPLLHTLGNWREILAATWWPDAVYRPFTGLTLAVDWTLSGGDPRWFHVVNVLLHVAATGMVFFLARRMLSGLGATAAAAVFAVHPVHVEAVANVVGRAEVLATLFALGAVVLYRWDGELAEVGDAGGRRALASFGALGCLLLGLASKETAFVTPGLLLLVDWLAGRRLRDGWADAVRRHWVLWFGSIALTLEWLWIWVGVVGELEGGGVAPALMGEGLVGRAAVMAAVVPEYFRLLVLPAELSADYSPNFLPVGDGLGLREVLGVGVLILGVGVAVAFRRRAPVVPFALAWVAGSLLIVSNILVPTEVLLAERTLYLPSVGAVLLFGVGFGWIGERRPVAGALAAALLVALGMTRTVTRVPVWRDNTTLLPQLVRDAPGSFRSYWVSGYLHYAAGDSTRGEELLRQALRIYPLHASLWTDLAQQLEAQGRWRAAAGAFNAAFRIDSTRLIPAAAAVRNYGRAGMVDSAAAIARRARAVDPQNHLVKLALGDAALARGRPLEAMTWRRQVAWRFPRRWRYWYLTAAAALEAEYCPEVRRSLEHVRELAPETPAVDTLETQAKMHCPAGRS